MCWSVIGVLDVSGVAGVMERDSLGNNLNISDIIEVIQMDPDFQDGEPLYGGGGGGTNMEDARKRSAHVKILEQPASKALRFRYECEGRSAGSIPGVNSTPENKTFPSIQVVGYKGRAVVVVSSGFTHRAQPTTIDLNAVRLCFQVFLEGNEKGKFTFQLPPVVSEPIYDKKAMSDLVICRLSDCSCTVAGGKEIILLCEKVAKEDIQVRFYEEREGHMVWEGFADFQPTHVHKQVAITFRTPHYRTIEVDAPVKAFVQLRRPSDGATSEPLPFEFLPLDSGRPTFWSLRKALVKKGNYAMFSSILASNTAYLTRQVGSGSEQQPMKVPLTASKVTFAEPCIEVEETVLSDDVQNGSPEPLLEPVEEKDVKRKDMDIEPPPQEDMITEQEPVDDYSQVNKWDRIQSHEDDNGNIESTTTYEKDPLQLDTRDSIEDVLSEGETNRSLNELLSQVAELDDIYSDTRARLLDAGGLELLSQDGRSPEDIEMGVEEYFDDSQTYSSLQLAMKNPVELLDFVTGRYEDVTPPTSIQPPFISIAPLSKPIIPPHLNIAKRENTGLSSLDSSDSKLPPLPPKRSRKEPPTPPARPEHLLNYEPPIVESPTPTPVHAPNKNLPETPALNAKVNKPNLFQKLFSKKSSKSVKKEKLVITPRGSVGNISITESGAVTPPELTEAEHYALYTDMAPHATASEFDETSFYYSPVEGGHPSKKRKRAKFVPDVNTNMLHDLDPTSSGMRIGRFNSPQPNHNLLQVKMEQVKMEPPDPKTQYTHQRQMYGGVLATTPSPNPSPSPQSHGRTPSPMDYTPAPAHAFYHPTSGMVMYRHTDFMGMGEVFQSPQVPAEGMGGAVNGKFFPSHLPTNPLVMFNPQRVLNPARRMPQTDMDMSGQGSTWGPVPPSSSPAISSLLDHSSMNIPPPAVSSVAGSVNPGEGSILDLDSHQYSLGQLDSAELANLSLFDGNLSENLSSNLTLSENPPPELKQEQPTQQQQNDVQQENMTDSFTRLTTTTLEDICKLNSMYKGGRDG
uniref:RHD domain-containing protein n=1 Tax=Timema bartmani TaxID=61472 RepID=A0A7R9EZU3_9NEOP|nr:unnamed protein product [Timema bartmani]